MPIKVFITLCRRPVRQFGLKIWNLDLILQKVTLELLLVVSVLGPQMPVFDPEYTLDFNFFFEGVTTAVTCTVMGLVVHHALLEQLSHCYDVGTRMRDEIVAP